MSVTYFKRQRMEIDLRATRVAAVELLPGYRLVPWHESLLAQHAEVKYHSFRNEIDACVFPCLSTPEGCHDLMVEIAGRDQFLPGATWLVEYDAGAGRREMCGTIQGMASGPVYGAIQNVGVTPFHRGRGVAGALVSAALGGFAAAGLPKAYLEVTVQNTAAFRLYQRLGFRQVKTLYKAVDIIYS
jgi:GNAT superfamily N-acetyltransferase